MYLTVDELMRANCLESELIQVGQELCLPYIPTPTPTWTPTPTLSPTPTPTSTRSTTRGGDVNGGTGRFPSRAKA